MTTFAPEGFRYYRVSTPSVFVEVLLDEQDVEDGECQEYDELAQLAERHGTHVENSLYQCG